MHLPKLREYPVSNFLHTYEQTAFYVHTLTFDSLCRMFGWEEEGAVLWGSAWWRRGSWKYRKRCCWRGECCSTRWSVFLSCNIYILHLTVSALYFAFPFADKQALREEAAGIIWKAATVPGTKKADQRRLKAPASTIKGIRTSKRQKQGMRHFHRLVYVALLPDSV